MIKLTEITSDVEMEKEENWRYAKLLVEDSEIILVRDYGNYRKITLGARYFLYTKETLDGINKKMDAAALEYFTMKTKMSDVK